jgi:hypothetical protein
MSNKESPRWRMRIDGMSTCSLISDGRVSTPSVSSVVSDCVGLVKYLSFTGVVLMPFGRELFLPLTRMELEGRKVAKSVRCH